MGEVGPRNTLPPPRGCKATGAILRPTSFRVPSVTDEPPPDPHTIAIYADLVTKLFGFTGEAAEDERRYIVTSLSAREPVDYKALQERAGKHVREGEIRAMLQERGLTDGQIDELLDGYPSSD